MLGCHTLMLGYQPDEAPDLDWAFADFDDEVLGLACVNSMKPGREGGFALVLQTRHYWSQAHIEDDLEMVSARIKQRFQELTGCSTAASAYDSLHRWRYASTCQAAATQAQPYLLDDEQGLSAIGDWCSGWCRAGIFKRCSSGGDIIGNGGWCAHIQANQRFRNSVLLLGAWPEKPLWLSGQTQ